MTDYQNAGMNDIIFENRNKAYGAYVLRRDYNKSLGKAILISASIVLSLCCIKFLSDKFSSSYSPPVENSIIATITDILPPVAPPTITPPPPTQSTQASTVNGAEFKVTQNQQSQDSIATQDDLNNADNIGLTNTAGDAAPGVGDVGGTGTRPSVAIQVPVVPPVLDIVEVMPKFPGGDEALMKFLRDHTQYPSYEEDLGLEGKVYVKFVVNEDGSISNAEIMRSETKGFGREAVRVVNILPKFIPGMQSGRNVKVHYVLPFSFKHRN